MDASSPVTADPSLPPVITGLVVLGLLAILRAAAWLLFSSHHCKGRNNSGDYNTPGEGIVSALAHLGEDVYRWTGEAAALVFVALAVWCLIGFAAGHLA
ncbi:hypothetical protein ACWGBV_01725 [Streptomyces sp. NPDC055051]